MIEFEETRLGGEGPPLVWRITAGQDAKTDDIRDWLAAHKDLYDQRLDRDGAVLIRGFECLRSAEDFAVVLAAAGGELMSYIGGTSPRRAVHGGIMTSTDAPREYSIPLHQEMSYTANAPERISFFCVTPSSFRGETTIAGMRTVTSLIGNDLVARFKNKGGLQLRRNLPAPGNVQTRPGVPKSWTEVFATVDQEVADQVAHSRGWRTEWLSDGSVQLWQEVLPATRVHPRTGDEVWFNQIHIFDPVAARLWAIKDGRIQDAARIELALRKYPHLLDRVLHADGSQLDAQDVAHVANVFDRAAVPLAWRSGDLLMIDNILVAHGRTQYDGERLLLAALLNGCVEPVAAVA